MKDKLVFWARINNIAIWGCGVAWKDYESVSWFIRGKSNDDPGSQGSAIAVRLRRVGEAPKTYLLTCAHVVRGSDPSQGTGPVLKTLQAWRAGSGFTPEEARTVRVVALAHKSLDEPIPEDERGAQFDWILLEIENKHESLAAPSIPLWAGPNPEGRFLVCGYPGEQPFTRSVVKPTIPDHHLIPHELDLGVLRLTGDETRPGMSGGGLFDSDGLFIGIHRSKREAEFKLVAITADFIRRQLKEKGFQVVTDELPDDSRSIRELIQILLCGAYHEVDWQAVLNRWLPRASIHSKAVNLRDKDALIAALRELEKLGPDERGILPLQGFAHDLNKLKSTELLVKWINQYVPAGAQAKFQLPPIVTPKGEPRIVVELTPLGSADEEPALRNIEYQIWYEGFQRSPPYRREEDQLGRFDKVLERAWDAVRGQVDLKRVWVELFLPKELLAWKFEALDIRLGKLAVRMGSIHPFVFRLMNRESPLRNFDRSLCLQRYNSIDSIPQICGSHALIEAPGDSNPSDLLIDLEGKESVLGILWTSHPHIAQNEDPDVWDAVSWAGVPLVMWLRDIPTPRPDLGAEFQNKTWDQVAGVVKDLRNTGARTKGAWHLGQHLAIILDDDQRCHPRMSPFTSPNSSII